MYVIFRTRAVLCILVLVLVETAGADSILYNDEDSAHVAATIDTEKRYFVDMLVGSPPRRCSLRVDVTTDGISLELPDNDYLMVQSHPRYISTVHADDGGDIVYMNGFSYIDTVRYVPLSSLTSLPEVIGAYRGTFGLGKRSVLWRYWRNVEFTSTYIQFGAAPQTDFLAGTTVARVPMVDCLPFTSSLCQFYGTINNVTYIIDFFNNHRAFYVPRDVYMRYVEDRSLYANDVDTDNIVVGMADHSAAWNEQRCVERFRTHGFADIASCKDDYVFTLETDMYIDSKDRGRIKTNLLLQSTELYNNSAAPVFSFPIHTLMHISLYLFRGADWQFDMVIKPHQANGAQTTAEMVAWTIGFIVFAVYVTSYKFFVPVASIVPPTPGINHHAIPPPAIYVHANHHVHASNATPFGIVSTPQTQVHTQSATTVSMRIMSSVGVVSSLDTDVGVQPGLASTQQQQRQRQQPRTSDSIFDMMSRSIVFHIFIEMALYGISVYLGFPSNALLGIGINKHWIIHGGCITTAVAAFTGTYALIVTFATPHPDSSTALWIYYIRRISVETSVMTGFWMFWIRLRQGNLGSVALAAVGIIYIYRATCICTGFFFTSYHYRHAWKIMLPRTLTFVCIALLVSVVMYMESIHPYIFSLLGLYTDTTPILAFGVAFGACTFAMFKTMSVLYYIPAGLLRQLEKTGAITSTPNSSEKTKKE